MRIIVTGGAGFIGSAVVRRLIGQTQHDVLVIDKLTYAGNLASLETVKHSDRFHFTCTDICDSTTVARLFSEYKPDAVVHLAAESHVDRSIDTPADFIQTNIFGTYVLLESALAYWRRRDFFDFRLLHVSTDEVYGALGDEGTFDEKSPYNPRSPYAASKAASDHLVRAWHHTHRLPVVLTNCSNNYGPYQFPEKLIPTTIISALSNEKIPVYGDGRNVRDWVFVDDHARALLLVLERGQVGETYVVSGDVERRNLDVVGSVCDTLDKISPRRGGASYRDLISFVPDRPGHDFRYALNSGKIKHELGWKVTQDFNESLAATVQWYVEQSDWWRPLLSLRHDTASHAAKVKA